MEAPFAAGDNLTYRLHDGQGGGAACLRADEGRSERPYCTVVVTRLAVPSLPTVEQILSAPVVLRARGSDAGAVDTKNLPVTAEEPRPEGVEVVGRVPIDKVVPDHLYGYSEAGGSAAGTTSSRCPGCQWRSRRPA